MSRTLQYQRLISRCGVRPKQLPAVLSIGLAERVLMAVRWAVRANGLVRHVSGAALHAIVDRDLADRPQRFVVERGHAERGTQFFVELTQILQMRSQRRQLDAFVGQQKFLVAGIPQARKLALHHDRWKDGELKSGVGTLAKLRAATVFLHTN